MNSETQHVFLIGAKNIGAYGGYETFAEKLTEYHQDISQIKYHIACKANGTGFMDEGTLEGAQAISNSEFIYRNAHCFKIHVPEIGAAQALYYDVQAIKYCCNYIKENKIEHPIVYIMACRIGPVMKHYYKKIHKLGGVVYLNPDGHEWARAKWNALIRRYWKISERQMIKNCDLVICDSKTIEKYVHASYDETGPHGGNPNTTFISYGAETRKSKLADDDPKLLEWYREKQISPGSYYLVVGRFVPENNYDTMIQEFLESKTDKDFVLITTNNEKFLKELEKKLHFQKDDRIKFVGTLYDQELLMKIRENAYGYLHGHEVGGTNPSLLEALGSTNLNLLLDVGFNREVAEDAALYWTKDKGSLSSLIETADRMSATEIRKFRDKACQRIKSEYSWQYIMNKYQHLFLSSNY